MYFSPPPSLTHPSPSVMPSPLASLSGSLTPHPHSSTPSLDPTHVLLFSHSLPPLQSIPQIPVSLSNPAPYSYLIPAPILILNPLFPSLDSPSSN
ncbi:hypothetical protein FKM82_000726 [Ascaphus truei]